MRATLIATSLLFAFVQMAAGESAPPEASDEALTISISADGICHFLETATRCEELGPYLLSKHLAQNGHVHILVDRASKYELIRATLESLDRAGFKKVGFVNKDFQ